MLPRDHAPGILLLARGINAALSAFVRGQMTVCLLLGSFYSAALMLAGLQFGLLVGAIAGAITFIPYVGRWWGGRWPLVWRCSSSGVTGCRSVLWLPFLRRASSSNGITLRRNWGGKRS